MPVKVQGNNIKAPSEIVIQGRAVKRDIGGVSIAKMYGRIAIEDEMLDDVSYTGFGYAIIVSLDRTPHGDLIHASISLRDRNPTWEEISDMKAGVYGDQDVMMVLPRRENYVNLHRYAFHLWQMPFAWDIR